jgi:hypothetical protein
MCFVSWLVLFLRTLPSMELCKVGERFSGMFRSHKLVWKERAYRLVLVDLQCFTAQMRLAEPQRDDKGCRSEPLWPHGDEHAASHDTRGVGVS